MIDWVNANKEWLFSGLGVLLVSSAFGIFSAARKRSGAARPQSQADLIGNSAPTQSALTTPSQLGEVPERKRTDEAHLKATARILFIDDDRSFKIVSVLRKSGWRNVDIVTDVQRLDAENVRLADIIFVDIQGVGKKLEFSDEGLGLARALRETYPSKKLVIYSAVSGHDPFAEGFRVADDRLSKNAEPYEFQKTIVDLLS